MHKEIRHIKLDDAIKAALNGNKVEGFVYPWDEIEPNIQKKFRNHPFKDFSFSFNSFIGIFSISSFIDKTFLLTLAKKWSVSMYMVAGSMAISAGGYYAYQTFSTSSDNANAENTIPTTITQEKSNQLTTSNFSSLENNKAYNRQLENPDSGILNQETQSVAQTQDVKNTNSTVTSNRNKNTSIEQENNTSEGNTNINSANLTNSSDVNINNESDFSSYSNASIVAESSIGNENSQSPESDNYQSAFNTSDSDKKNTSETKGVSVSESNSGDGKKGLLNKLFTTNPKSRYKRSK